MKQTRSNALLVCAVLALVSQSALGVINGFNPDASTPDNAVINPFNGLATNAWKLVGKYYDPAKHSCTATQITREWILTAQHCFPPDGRVTAEIFETLRGASEVKHSDCVSFGANQEKICRLSNPERLSAPPTYPKLAVLPSAWLSALTPRKYGSLMGQGYGFLGSGLAFVDLEGFTAKLQNDGTLVDHELTNYQTVPNPSTSGGDSGGAFIWFDTDSSAPYVVGYLESQSSLLTSANKLTSSKISQIVETIRQRGDAPPDVVDLTTLVSVNNGERPTPLSPALTIARVGNTEQFNLNWQTPSANPVVSTFQLSIGEAGATLLRQNLSPSASSNALSLTLPLKKVDVCVRPFNALGGSQPMTPRSTQPMSPNCVLVDNRVNQTTITNLMGQSGDTSGTLGTVAFTWGANASPADLVLTGYRVQQSVTISGALTRTGNVTTLSTNRTLVSAPKGSRVCLNVSSLAANGKVGPMSSACATAR